MTYTPINWQTGDTITAEKLNRCDNGWGVSSAQIFSETATTADTGQGFAAGSLVYVFQSEPPAEAVVTFDGTSYTVERNASFSYGEAGASGPDFTNYPFYISPDNQETSIFTATAGTYSITFGTESVEVSSGFDTAVNACVDTSTMPMECVSGTTTLQDMGAAYSSGRIMFFRPYGNSLAAISYVTSFDGISVTFIPENPNVTAGFENNVFTITISN